MKLLRFSKVKKADRGFSPENVESVCFCRKTDYEKNSGPEGRQIVARGSLCSPLVMDQRMNEPRQGRKKSLPGKSFRPCRGSIVASPFQGFAALTPGYFLIAPAGACVRKIVSRQKLAKHVGAKAPTHLRACCSLPNFKRTHRTYAASLISICIIWLAILPYAYPQAKGVVEGRLINGTNPSISARGIELDVMGLGSGMNVIRTATADSSGHFRIEGLPENQELLIRANYKGANYHSPIKIPLAGKASVEIEVFEPADSMKDISVEGMQIVFQMVGDQLKAVESVQFNNKTKPPRTFIGPEGSFRISKPPGILEPPLMRVTAPGSKMPLVQSALESADGKSYYSLYPLRPGITTFEAQELLPYTNRNYKYVTRFYQNISELKVGVIPRDIDVSGNGLSKIDGDSQKNFTVYASSPIKAGTELVWTFSGGTPDSEPQPSETEGEPSIQTVPNDIERNALIIGPLLLLGFVLALWYAFNHSRNRMQ
jgi:hypothetical protein